ncbi:outer membrane beta-barrel protein [uncultured Fluviicola sp.]|uniref:outer membrane beta-barrel protein n=1 Tax=uncultured Fluviicola sp. TaxID=463303 RepID=UPI0025D699F6|nr:outer membrane beta-barrel protein [uncultured Fluviicola sp.]
MPRSISISVPVFCVLSFLSITQKQKKERFPSYFGITASPVIPNNFIGSVHTELKDNSGAMTAYFDNKWGFTFGGTIRIGLFKYISMETGISQVRRVYQATVSMPDSNIYGSQKLALANYDIPLNALFYVPLTKKWLADASLGISLTHYPSNVQDSMHPKTERTIFVQGRRTERTYFAFNAGIGLEYRTLKAGTFFLGFGAKVPFKPPFFGVSIFRYSKKGDKISAYKPLEAGYFTIDFRYFIPTPKKKKSLGNKPLIE